MLEKSNDAGAVPDACKQFPTGMAETSARLLESALAKREAGEHDAAEAILRNLIAKDGQRPEYVVSLVRILAGKKSFDAAEKAALDALTDNPESKRLHALHGDVHFAALQWEDAREEYRCALKAKNNDFADPENIDFVYDRIGVSEMRLGNLFEARNVFRDLVERNPTTRRFLSHLTQAENRLCDHNPLYFRNWSEDAVERENPCISFRCPHKLLEPSLWKILSDSLVDGIPDVHGILPACEFVLRNSTGAFYVVQDSKWHELLAEYVAGGRVKVCQKEETLHLFMLKKTFILLDSEEFSNGLGQDVCLTLNGMAHPPTILTFGHFQALETHFDYVTGVVDTVRREFEAVEGDILYYWSRPYSVLEPDAAATAASLDNSAYVMGCFLYALVDKIVAIYNPVMRRCTSDDSERVEYPFNGRLSPYLRNADYSILVWNDKTPRFTLSVPGLRKGRKFYFTHGGRNRNVRWIQYNPMLLWLLTYGGTGRMYHVLRAILNYFGIQRFSRRHIAPKVFPFSVLNRSTAYFAHQFDEIDAIVKPACAAGVVTIHTVRDFRNKLVSMAFDRIGLFIRYGRYGTDEIKKTLGKLITNKKIFRYVAQAEIDTLQYANVRHIKFEDVVDDPLSAYKKLVLQLPVADDPYFDPEVVDQIIATESMAMTKETIGLQEPKSNLGDSLPKMTRRGHGGWRDYFDAELKDLFKAHDPGYLRAFGYESDDNW